MNLEYFINRKKGSYYGKENVRNYKFYFIYYLNRKQKNLTTKQK